MAQNPYTLQSSTTVYENQRLKVREDSVALPDGKTATCDVVETNDSVAIIALNEQEEICLVNVYRHVQNDWAWKLPGGTGSEAGPIHSAMRQLARETGFVANEYAHTGALRLHGMMTEKMQMVVMRRLVQSGDSHQQAEGVAEVKFLSMEGIEAFIVAGEIDDAGTIAAITAYKIRQQQAANEQA